MPLVKERNFYIEEGKAYTEDHVLVYNLFVHSVPKCITKEELVAFFGNFGTILKIRLTYNEDEWICSVVNFKDAKSAGKVLALNIHMIKKEFFGVRACETWDQPPPLELFPPEIASPRGVYKKPKQLCNVNLDPGPAATPSIDGVNLADLNNDCLEHIFKFLDIRDQLKLARVSQSFRGIVEMLCKRKYRVLKWREDLSHMTLWELRDFLALAGPHIQAFVGFYCCVRDLKRFAIERRPISELSLRKYVSKFRALRKLDMEHCEVDDHTLAIISHLPNLEMLNLAHNHQLIGESLKHFTSLRELNLSGCWSLNRQHFAAMCAELTELRSLDISGCRQLDGGCLIQLAEHRANQLEVLKMTFNTGSPKGEAVDSAEAAEAIGKLKRLRVLHVSNATVNDETIHHFVKLDQLEELGLNRLWNSNDEALLRLLGSCKSVRSVSVE